MREPGPVFKRTERLGKEHEIPGNWRATIPSAVSGRPPWKRLGILIVLTHKAVEDLRAARLASDVLVVVEEASQRLLAARLDGVGDAPSFARR